jgi:hypothetical protein
MEYLFSYLLFMFLTGSTNAMYYKENKVAHTTLVTTIFMLLIVYWIYVLTQFNGTELNAYVFAILIILPHYFNGYKLDIYRDKLGDKVHLNEYLLNGSFVLINFFFAKVDGLMYICAMHLGGVVFNLYINKVHSGQFLEEVDYTDDPTGKTVGVYIFGSHFRIPRISNSYTQLYLGLFLTSVWIVNQYTYKYKVVIDLFNKSIVILNTTYNY